MVGQDPRSPERRQFLAGAAAAIVASAAPRLTTGGETDPRPADDPTAAGPARAAGPNASTDWASVREQFAVSPDWLHFAAFFLVSHPRPVREAIEKLRRELDANPFEVVEHGMFVLPPAIRAAAARYVGGAPEEIALVRSTTEGLALVYAGLSIRPDQEVLTTTHDHYVHHEAARLATSRVGAGLRKVALYDAGAAADEKQMAERLEAAIRPATRVVGLTWVHSSTGVKLPVRTLADVVARANESRGRADRILLVLDGVHGFGVDDTKAAELGCDFFCAGTHKWILGPRGTGIVWARADAWTETQPTVPAFEEEPYAAWMEGRRPAPTRGVWMSPGGFHAYEHMWALPAAFDFVEGIGPSRIAARLAELNGRIKDGLAEVPGVTIHTPRDPRLSGGIVCFEKAGTTPDGIVRGLHARRIIASTSPYRVSYARLAGSLLNTPEEVDRAVAAVAALS